ncbi:MAG: MASE1 domain-containing protein [Hyphomicrobiaceae bacterium]|nr:MASE1 domain-containing protein [Hyphomicrobiaceae bacterium]
MAFPRLLTLPSHVIALGFLVGYVTLDWISFVHPFGPFGITPWNPPTGLSFVLILLFGQRHLPLLFLAPLLADLMVRGQAATWPVSLLTSVIIGSGYSTVALALLRPAVRLDVSLSSMRDLALLLLAAVVSAAAVAVGCVAVYVVADLVAWTDASVAVIRFWVGDLIGIAVTTPFLLILLTRGRPVHLTWETWLQIAAIGMSLLLVFTLGQSRPLQLFYLLFLPIVWIAVRSGLEGVTMGLVLTQLGLIIAMQASAPSSADVTAFQALMLVLALTGLAAGVLVTERRRAELQLRLQQDAQARLTRLGSMGELASALAHEINQPLMAAGTYTRLAAEAIAAGGSPEKAGEAAAKAVAQVERASEVVRRLRDLIRLGRSELAPVGVARIIDEALELLRPEIERGGVRVERQVPADLPLIMADMLQVEQVLLNLVRNAIEAIRDAGMERGTITISAVRAGSSSIEIHVADSGPGFAFQAAGAISQPFATTKPDGLGVGLSLSRSIIEAHGGQLILGKAEQGALVRFTLPVAEAA